MRKIWLARARKYAIVDDEDYDLLSKYKWHAFKTGHNVQCYTQEIRNGDPWVQNSPMITMQKMIVGQGRPVFQRDGNGFNCRRSNLSIYANTVTGKMTDELKEFILGTLLGDTGARVLDNVYGERRFSLMCGHGKKQKAYLMHKSRLLSAYVTNCPKSYWNKGGRGFPDTELWRFSTVSSSDFDFLKMCYDENGKKRVSQEWVNSLTITSLAYWYMDDGNLNSNRYVFLFTNGFSVPECDLLVKRLGDMGFDASVKIDRLIGRDKKEYPKIKMDYWASKKFLSRIDHLIVDSLKYKSDILDAFKKVQCYFCGYLTLACRTGKRAICRKKRCRAAYNREIKEWRSTDEYRAHRKVLYARRKRS